MIQVDEEHMDGEMEYLLTNPTISKIDIQNHSLKQIKYGLLFFKYVNLLKEESKMQENKENDLLNLFIFNNDISINIEYDLNKINIEKERIDNLEDEKLFKETFIKIRFIKNLNYFYITDEKYYEYNLDFYNYISIIKSPYFHENEFLNNIEINKKHENFKRFCLKFLKDSSYIKLIKNKNHKIMNEILNREDIERIFKNVNEGEIINNNELIKELENKSLEELLKEIYTDNLIDIKEILNIFEVNDYKKIFKNTYYFLKELLENNINLSLSIEDLLEKFSSNEIFKNEFKDFLLIYKKKKYLKQYKSQSSYLPELFEFLNNKKCNMYSITKQIPLDNEKKLKI